jgi:predicted metal-dependent phosphoesterase TrpH
MPEKGKVDLHIHSTASSDGQHSPREIFEMAGKIGLRAIAFADHNSVDSLDEGLKLSKEYGIEFIPCFELNTIYDDMDIHMLAYYVDHHERALHSWLAEIHEAKYCQAEKRLKALKTIGFDIDQRDLDSFAGGRAPSGATFLSALLSKDSGKKDPKLQPYIDGKRSDSPSLNFYLDYFRKDKLAFVPLDICPIEDGIKKIRQFGGVPVQAHPSDTGDKNIIRFIELGMMGLEAYSSYHDAGASAHFCKLAKEHGVLHTAGSDFHGKKIKPNVELGDVDGNSYEIVERLKDARKKI